MSNSPNGPQGLLASMAFGGVFFLMGSFIVLISADIIHVDPSSFNAPRWVVGCSGWRFYAGRLDGRTSGWFWA